MYPAITYDRIVEIRSLPVKKSSMTFHGRDIFSVYAAKLENGTDIREFGKDAELNGILEFYNLNRVGEVVRVDNFGNIITNLEHINKKSYKVFLPGKRSLLLTFYETYEKAGNGLFLIEGSSNTLEISARNMNANKILKLNVGDMIKICQ